MPSESSPAVDEMVDALRELASRTLMFHQAITDRVGLGPSDMKALDLARTERYLTAGRLAQVIGLSTSATTAVLDRLERRGFVERQRDPADRRKVVVVATGQHERQLGGIFARVEARTRELLGSYTDADLTLLETFVRRINTNAELLTREVAVEAGQA